jgi:hypothetical protein
MLFPFCLASSPQRGHDGSLLPPPRKAASNLGESKAVPEWEMPTKMLNNRQNFRQTAGLRKQQSMPKI